MCHGRPGHTRSISRCPPSQEDDHGSRDTRPEKKTPWRAPLCRATLPHASPRLPSLHSPRALSLATPRRLPLLARRVRAHPTCSPRLHASRFCRAQPLHTPPARAPSRSPRLPTSRLFHRQAGEGQAGSSGGGTLTKRPSAGARSPAGGTVARKGGPARRPTSGGGARPGGGGQGGILRFYTDDAPGLKMCARASSPLSLPARPLRASCALIATSAPDPHPFPPQRPDHGARAEPALHRLRRAAAHLGQVPQGLRSTSAAREGRWRRGNDEERDCCARSAAAASAG